MKVLLAATLIVCAAVMGGLMVFQTQRIRDTPAVSYVVSDARQIVMECLIYEASLSGDHRGERIDLVDALAGTDEAFRTVVERRIASGALLFYPPVIPVSENRIVCIVLLDDQLVTIDGTASIDAYQRKRK